MLIFSLSMAVFLVALPLFGIWNSVGKIVEELEKLTTHDCCH